MTAFDVCGPLPTGTTVLEASAGTGKTFTIAALTVRYVAEGVADLSQLMLVTFGNVASRELRDRVRERLVTAERGLRNPDAARAGDDPVLQLLAGVPDAEAERRRLRLAAALADFDAATIATTHSFCSQMLAGLGVAADADPTAVFTASIDDLVQEVVDDLYVRVFARPGVGPDPSLTYGTLLDLGRRAVGSDRQALLWPLEGQAPPTDPAGRRRRAADAVRREVEARKRRGGLVDYDDWQVLLRDALVHPDHGEMACGRIRDRFRVVLVDEFQDTDPVQWQILRTAFHGSSTLVLIGDPKQAIYAFRGGDVLTYLQAAAVASRRETLTRNWRSDRGLLGALEQLFGGAALGDPRIVVRPVDAVHPSPRLTDAGAPLRIRRVGRTGHGPLARGLPRVGPVRDAVAADVAADVVELLTGPARLHGVPVRPRDVAVLVRTNLQGRMIRDALTAAGVPATLAGGGSVFTTPAARAWLVLLEAVEQPHRSGRVRAAAVSPFFGVSETTLDADGDPLTDRLGARLRRGADLLADRGVAALLETLSAEENLPARILARPDGDRTLTDLRHIGQLLHAAQRNDSLGLSALVGWLRHRIAESSADQAEDRTRRLDSDAAAVQVMTVHVSKGLEFPVVYVPFGWDCWSPDRPEILRLHDDDGSRVLDVGGKNGPTYRASLARHREAESGEELRLLYVALTRAQCQVVAHWAPSGNTAGGALNRLLFGGQGPGAVPAASVAPPPDPDVVRRVDELASRSGGLIEVDPVAARAASAWGEPMTAGEELTAAVFTRTLDDDWRRTSYSALTAAAHEPALGSEPDLAVKDDETDDGVSAPASPPGAVPSPLTALPGGTVFGTLVHEILEDPDPQQLDRRCTEALGRRPLSGVTPTALADALRPVLCTPLGSLGTTLTGVPSSDRLAELEFELPMAGGDTCRPHATLADVVALLRRHDLGALAGYPDVLATLDPVALRGFLTGSIDAVLRLPGPRYVVVDYKTNRLGAEPLTTWHYRPDAMAAEMLRAHYVLQALLYSVALHRYLRWRQPGYEPARHLGPVLYLFVRGMTGTQNPGDSGVFTWSPGAALVVELSDLLAGRA